MEINFVHTQILVHLHVNKTNFHTKGFALELALKQRRKATRESPIGFIRCTADLHKFGRRIYYVIILF